MDSEHGVFLVNPCSGRVGVVEHCWHSHLFEKPTQASKVVESVSLRTLQRIAKAEGIIVLTRCCWCGEEKVS